LTTRRGEKFQLNADLNADAKSTAEVKSPVFDGDLEVEPFGSRKVGRWSVNLKQRDIHHDFQVTGESGRVTLKTQTQKNKRNIVSIDATASPQQVDISYQGSRGKKQAVRIQNEAPDRDSRKVTIKYLEDGKQVALHENFGQMKRDGRGQVEILVAMTGKIEGRYVMGVEEYHFGVNHKHNLRRDSVELSTAVNGEVNREGQYQLKLDAQKAGDRSGRASLKAKLETPLSHLRSQTLNGKVTWEPSRIHVEALTSDGEGRSISVSGDGEAKNERVALDGEIKSDFVHIPSARIEGSLDKNNLKLVAHLNNEKQFSVSGHQEYRAMDNFKANLASESVWSPRYEVEAQTVRGSQGVQYELKARKDESDLYQVSGSHSSQRNGWQSQVDVTQSGKPYARLTFSNQNRDTTAKLTIGDSYQIELDSKMGRQILSGPHDIVVYFGHPQTPDSLKFHHEIGQGQLKCNLKYYVGGEEKVVAENTGRFSSNDKGVKFDAIFRVKSEYKYHELDGLYAGLSHSYERRGNGYESQTQLKGQIGQYEKVQLDISSDKSESRNEGKATFIVSLQTPVYDYKSQNFAAQAAWKRGQMEVSAKGTNRDGSVEATATLTAGDRTNGDRATGRFELKSDFKQIPSLKIDAAADRSSAHLNADVDGRRKVAIQGKADVSDRYNFEGQLDVHSPWTPRLTASAKGERKDQQAKYNLHATSDGTELVSLSLNGQMDKDLMKSSARMSAQSSELFRLDFESQEDRSNYRNRGGSKRVTKVGFNCGAQCNAQIKTSVSKDLVAGPHDLEISMNARNPRSVKVHHEILNGRVHNSVKYTVNGREEFAAEASGKVEGEAQELKIDSEIKITSDYAVKNVKQLNVRVNHKHSLKRGSMDLDSIIQGNVEGKKYEGKVKSRMVQVRGEGEVTLSASAQTPRRGLESVDGRFKWNPEQGSLEIKSLDGKQRSLLLTTQASHSSGKYEVKTEIKSDYKKVPSTKLLISTDDKTVSLTADVNGQRKITLAGKGEYKSFSDFQAQVEGTSAWSRKYSASVSGKKDRRSAEYNFHAKEDNRELVSAQGKAYNDNQSWKSNLVISHRSNNLLNLEAQKSGQQEKDVSVVTIALGNGQQLTFNSKVHQRQLLSGPHDLKIDLVTPRNLKSWEVHRNRRRPNPIQHQVL